MAPRFVENTLLVLLNFFLENNTSLMLARL